MSESAADAAKFDRLIRSPDRLAAVQRTELLDTLPEEAFDVLTRLAALLLKAPASFVSIVDSERDFYFSQVGFPAPLASSRQLSGRTFCHHALAQDEPLVISDTYSQPAWKSVPTVDSLGIRAYVGVPLRVDGQTVGSFCVIDNQPREWNATELEIIGQLAMSAARELSLREAARRARREAQRAQDAVVAKEKIIAVVAHDLRSPLQVIKLSAVLLEHTGADAHRVLARRMLNAIDAMQSLVQELLFDNGIASAQRSRPERIGVAKLLGDVLDTMAPIAARAGIVLQLRSVADDEVTVDHAQMLRVFSNLVGNAAKHCATGSNVFLAAARDGDHLLLSVADDGCGLSAEQQGHAFEAGWQGAESLARGDGNGLGLSIVRTLVQHNGGQVDLASQLGQGTTVTVRLRRVTR